MNYMKGMKTIMAYSVNISVEAPIENQIQEITYDGQEIYQAYVNNFCCQQREYIEMLD